MRPKVVLALEYPLDLPGGVSVLVRTLARKLSASCDLLLVSPDSDQAFEKSPFQRYFIAHYQIPSQHWNAANSAALASWIVSQGGGIAHFHLGGVFGWNNRRWFGSPIHSVNLRGIRCFTTVHLVVSPFDGYCDPRKPLWFKLLLFPFAWFAKLLQLYHVESEVTVSQHDQAKMRRWYRPAERKFQQIYHSILNDNQGVASFHRREPMVLSVGHIAFRKGQHVLAEAFARIARKFPDWNLWIVGHNAESACWDYIEEIIQRPGLKERIRLVGPTGKPEELMRRTSIFVQPSRWEALGLALQEALYYGCPSVGTAVGGIPELIDDGVNGLLIPPDDSAAMAAALEKLLTDEAMRRRFSEAAPKSIIGKGMTSDIMASEYLALYRSSTQPMETFQ